MLTYLGDFRRGQTIYFPFATYGADNQSITLSGLAVTDIEVYKLPSMTQRASDAGYTLLDTDGIDLDGIVGIHGLSINTGDNTDAGFYARYNEYMVIVDAVTVDTQTVRFVFGFSLENRHAPLLIANGQLSGTHSSTTADLGTNAPSVAIAGATLHFPDHKISVVVDSYDTGTGVATFSPSISATLTNGNDWELHATPKASTANPVPASLQETDLGSIEDRVDTALANIHLDHLLAADYDPASKPGVATALLNELVESDGGVARYTANALEQAPSGGLDAAGVRSAVGLASANLDTQLGDLPTNAELTSALAAADDAVLAAIAALDTVVDRVETDTQDIQSRIPTALDNGFIPASVKRVHTTTLATPGSGTQEIGGA